MPRKPNNYNPVTSVTNIDDLRFQTYQFDPRINRGGNSVATGLGLSANWYNRAFGDRSLAWELGEKIKKAARVLRGE